MRRHPDYLLSAYLFDSISAVGRVEVEAHLSGCGSCRDELEELRRTVAAIEDAFSGSAAEAPSQAGLRAQ